MSIILDPNIKYNTGDAGLERMAFPIFFKKYHYFRESQLTSKFKQIDKDIQLPAGSVLHLLDNFKRHDLNLPIIDTPENLSENIFVKNEKFRKYVYHNIKPLVTGDVPIIIEDNYVFRSINLDRNLKQFRQEYTKKGFLFTLDVNSIQKQNSTLTIVNHNPIFRTFTRGILSTYRAFNVILASILNFISKIDYKHHYVVVPLTESVYTRDQFRMVEKELKGSAIRHKENYHYLFMIQWFNFINTASELSLFERYPESMWDKTTFVFQVPNDYMMFWTLSDLSLVNPNNRSYNRLLNQFNSLALLGTQENSDNSITDQINDAIDKDTSITNDNKETKDVKKDSSLSEDSTKIKEDDKKIESTINQISKHVNKPIVEIGDSDTSDIITNIQPKKDIIEATVEIPINNDVEQNLRDTNKKEIPLIVPDSTIKPNIKNIKPPVPTTKEIISNQENITKEEIKIITYSPDINIKPFTTKEKIKEVNKEYLESLVNDTETFLKNTPELTQNQRNRCKQLLVKMMDIKVEGYSIIEQILKEVNPTLSTSPVSVLKDYVPDPSMIESTIQDFDKAYMDKYYLKDLLSTAISFSKQGMFLTGIEEDITSNELTRVKNYKFSYEDYKGKKHTVKFSIPILADDHTILVNGVRSYLKKQPVALPVTKISSTIVALASNYNKFRIVRNTNTAHNFFLYFKRLLNNINKIKPNSIKLFYNQINIDKEIKLPYEYTEIATTFSRISYFDSDDSLIEFTFDYTDRFLGMNDITKNKVLSLEKSYGTYLGRKKSNTPLLYFMSISNEINVIDSSNLKPLIGTSSLSLIDMLHNRFSVKLASTLTEWANIEILDKSFPVVFVLGYRLGLTNLLQKIKCKYLITDKERTILVNGFEKLESVEGKLSKVGLSLSDISIPFKDKILWIKRYPFVDSLIVSGLTYFDTTQYELSELDGQDVYYRMLIDKNGIKTNYLKGIDDSFRLFMDNITYRNLKQMNLPTTLEDLIIYAVRMLTCSNHKEAASMSNFRIRSYERFNAVLYNTMAREFAKYSKRTGAGNTFSVNPNDVILRILQDQAMLNVEDINPVHDIKNFTTVTYTGIGGRKADSFTATDRRYPDDAVGILSEATPDSGAVGITATLSMNPILVNIDGFIDNTKNKKELDPTQILSVSNVLMPGTTQDDLKRSNFVSIQLSHQMATTEGECMRVRTGFERVMAHRCNDIFAYVAKHDGKVVAIDELAKLIKIQYNDNSLVTIPYGDQFGYCSDLVTTQKTMATVKLGDTFKKDDVLTYNPEFFEKDLYSRQVDWKHGVVTNVAIMEIANTFEDSNVISRELGARLSINPIQTRIIVLTKNTYIHKFIKLNQPVDINDYLIVFEDADAAVISNDNSLSENSDLVNYLARLNRKTPKAKFTGNVVKVDVYYGCDIKDMHPTLAKMINYFNTPFTEKHTFSKNTNSNLLFPAKNKLPRDTKFKGVRFDENTVVIQYYIQENLESGIGDKLVFDSSLKSITSNILPEPVYSLKGRKVDAIFSGTSISNRIVNSPMIIGTAEQVMEDIENEIVDMWKKID